MDTVQVDRKDGKIRKAFLAAFPYTIPIFAGFWFLGLTYGVYMNTSGFSFLYPMLMSLTIFAGSIEFVTVNMLLSAFNPVQALVMALMINARHLFYGISMLDKYKGTGKKKVYLIFGMCDESFSINYTAKIPDGVDRGWFMFFVTLLNHFYWFSGSTIGGILGSLIHFNTDGLEFVMTSMFVVIFTEQWLKDREVIKKLPENIPDHISDVSASDISTSNLNSADACPSDACSSDASSSDAGSSDAGSPNISSSDFNAADVSSSNEANQFVSGKMRHLCSVFGILISLVCLILFGSDRFIVMSMIALLVVLALLRKFMTSGRYKKWIGR